MEKKFEEITESVKESEIQNKKLSQNIKSIEMDFSAKFRKTTEVIGQLQLEMREKDKETGSSLEEIVEKCKKVEKETKQTIDTFIKTIKDKYEKCIQNKNDQIKQSKKVGYGTMQIIVCFVSVALLCFQVETAIKAIKSDEIKPLKTEVDVIEKRVKQINFQIELDKFYSYNTYIWKMNGIEEIVKKTEYEIESDVFPVFGYPFKAKAKLQIKEDGHVHASLAFIDEKNTGSKVPLKVLPRVTFTLKDLTNNDKDIVRKTDHLFNDSFQFDTFHYEGWLLKKSKLLDSIYKRDNYIILQIGVDPPSIANSFISDDGIFISQINNYKIKKQKEIDDLEWDSQSPYFYTSSEGYRVVVFIYSNGFGDYKGKGLSFVMAYLSGEHDSTLSGSSFHKITLILFNQLDSSQNYNKTVKMDLRDELYCIIDLLPHNEFENDGFLKDDRLFYKVVIEPI
ncbi:hypothetical protein CHUAL_001159 [Chamberlinius hualienensis]